MASVDDMIEQIKSLQQQNEVRSQETQALRNELKQEEANRANDIQKFGQEVNNITVNYQAEIEKIKNDIIEMIKKKQQEEQEYGHGSSEFKDKNAKDFKPDKWTGEKDKINFREFYDSMLN